MEKGSVTGDILDGMADCMAEIQQRTSTLSFSFVIFYERRLYFHAPLD